jgi:hypothetical protein
MTALDDAVGKVIDTVNATNDAGFRHDQVAIQWPSLAVALAELMDMSGRKPPASWRQARREAAENA